MKHVMKSAFAVLLCAALLTACGSDPADLEAELDTDTTTVSAEETTTADTTDITTDDTTAAETTETTTNSDAGTDSDADADEREDSEDDSDEADDDSQSDDDTPDDPQDDGADKEIIWDVLRVNESVAAYFENSDNGDYTFEEADSCMGSGKDRVYTFSDRVIMTYYENGSEILIELDITEAGIETRKGISVGSSVADLEAAYGTADDTGAYIFDTEDGTLQFMTDGSVVTFIALYE